MWRVERERPHHATAIARYAFNARECTLCAAIDNVDAPHLVDLRVEEPEGIAPVCEVRAPCCGRPFHSHCLERFVRRSSENHIAVLVCPACECVSSCVTSREVRRDRVAAKWMR